MCFFHFPSEFVDEISPKFHECLAYSILCKTQSFHRMFAEKSRICRQLPRRPPLPHAGPPSLEGGSSCSLLLANVPVFQIVKPSSICRSVIPLNIELKRRSFDSLNHSAMLNSNQ